MIQISVYGNPAPKGSRKFVGLSKAGRGILIESSKREKPWAEAVKWAALSLPPENCRVSGPVCVEMIFTMPKPKSAPKGRRTWPDRMPDLSKLVRSTEDALTQAGAWEDDARIVACTSMKVFPGEHEMSLGMPGAMIRIWSASVLEEAPIKRVGVLA